MKEILRKKKGFTLIELLIVIGIIAVLMAIAIVAINPARQFAKANNARRWADVNTTLNAVSQKIVDGRGFFACNPVVDGVNFVDPVTEEVTLAIDIQFPVTNCPNTGERVPTSFTVIRDTDGNTTTADYNICGCLTPTYVGSIPFDPGTGSYTACNNAVHGEYNTGYQIKCVGRRITVKAPDAQLGETIEVTR